MWPRRSSREASPRTYELAIPASYTGKTPYPLVFGLHPLSVSYEFMPAEVGFTKYQEKYHFIGVAPSGLTVPAPFWDAAPSTPNYDVEFHLGAADASRNDPVYRHIQGVFDWYL